MRTGASTETITTEDIRDAIAGYVDPDACSENRFGGYDFPGSFKGDTIRVAVDDQTIIVYTFSGGRAMLNSGEVRLSGGMIGMLATIISELA